MHFSALDPDNRSPLDADFFGVIVIGPRCPESTYRTQPSEETKGLIAAIMPVCRHDDVLGHLEQGSIWGQFSLHESSEILILIERLTTQVLSIQNQSTPGSLCVGGFVTRKSDLADIPQSTLQQMALLKLDSARQRESGVDVFFFDGAPRLRFDSKINNKEPTKMFINMVDPAHAGEN